MRLFVAGVICDGSGDGRRRARWRIADTDVCGVTLTQDVRLDANLDVRRATALTVGADGIRIDLNGHAIQGSGIGDGIVDRRATEGRHGREAGVLRGFAVAVRLNTASGVVVRERRVRRQQ